MLTLPQLDFIWFAACGALSLSSCSASPQVQFLQARRFLASPSLGTPQTIGSGFLKSSSSNKAFSSMRSSTFSATFLTTVVRKTNSYMIYVYLLAQCRMTRQEISFSIQIRYAIIWMLHWKMEKKPTRIRYIQTLQSCLYIVVCCWIIMFCVFVLVSFFRLIKSVKTGTKTKFQFFAKYMENFFSLLEISSYVPESNDI